MSPFYNPSGTDCMVLAFRCVLAVCLCCPAIEELRHACAQAIDLGAYCSISKVLCPTPVVGGTRWSRGWSSPPWGLVWGGAGSPPGSPPWWGGHGGDSGKRRFSGGQGSRGGRKIFCMEGRPMTRMCGDKTKTVSRNSAAP